MEKGLLLHVGCGGNPIPDWAVGRYDEVRLDISPDNSPDILASMTDMGNIGLFDGVYCSHALEHLAPHEVGLALAEFYRVVVPGGFIVLLVPDLEDVKATEEVLYEAPCGPVTGLDLIYGLRSLLHVMPFMAHKIGFVKDTLEAAINRAGFSQTVVTREAKYNLLGVAKK